MQNDWKVKNKGLTNNDNATKSYDWLIQQAVKLRNYVELILPTIPQLDAMGEDTAIVKTKLDLGTRQVIFGEATNMVLGILRMKQNLTRTNTSWYEGEPYSHSDWKKHLILISDQFRISLKAKDVNYEFTIGPEVPDKFKTDLFLLAQILFSWLHHLQHVVNGKHLVRMNVSFKENRGLSFLIRDNAGPVEGDIKAFLEESNTNHKGRGEFNAGLSQMCDMAQALPSLLNVCPTTKGMLFMLTLPL